MFGIALGLALGWMAQGMVENFMEPSSAAAAAPMGTLAQEATLTHDYAGAEHLVPPSRDHSVYHAGIAMVVSLFVLAIVVGKPALNVAGRSSPIESHDDEPTHLHRHGAPH